MSWKWSYFIIRPFVLLSCSELQSSTLSLKPINLPSIRWRHHIYKRTLFIRSLSSLTAQFLRCIPARKDQVRTQIVCVSTSKFDLGSPRNKEQIIFQCTQSSYQDRDMDTDSCRQQRTCSSSVYTLFSLPWRRVGIFLRTTKQIKMVTSLGKEELLGLFYLVQSQKQKQKWMSCKQSHGQDFRNNEVKTRKRKS